MGGWLVGWLVGSIGRCVTFKHRKYKTVLENKGLKGDRPVAVLHPILPHRAVGVRRTRVLHLYSRVSHLWPERLALKQFGVSLCGCVCGVTLWVRSSRVESSRVWKVECGSDVHTYWRFEPTSSCCSSFSSSYSHS